jgi:predicted TIM-barrel fold metal-dependent hydrolase
MIIDCHTHAFPDALAARALASIEKQGGPKHVLDGTVGGLLASMDRAGVDASLLLNIATKPEHFSPIMDFCRKVRSARIIPFPSIHPQDPQLRDHVHAVKAEGYKGIKLHNYYQNFIFDEERVWPLYAALEEEGLILAAHTGYDPSYPFEDVCRPARIVRVLDRFPGLKFMASHLGAWYDYEEVRRCFFGRPIHMEVSGSFPCLPAADIRDIIEKHGPHYVFFGSDSPWVAQEETLANLRGLGFSPDIEAMLEGGNAQRFFGL